VSSPSDSPGLARGQTVGRFVVLERIGGGSMGVVYAAYDPELDRRVALKLLRPQKGRRDQARRQERMVREAQAIAKLSHPNVVGIFDVGVHQGQVFMAMEHLPGGTLSGWTARNHSWREIVKMFMEVGRGLLAAHLEGLIHRDFKPDNVLLDKNGVPKVVDFGLVRRSTSPDSSSGVAADPDANDSNEGSNEGELVARSAARLTSLTRTGALTGTPAYMAPEQFLGQTVDARTDQFSFCVGLYEALYGERPFAGETVIAIAASVTSGVVGAAPGRTNVPGWIRRVLLRGLAAEPEMRFPSMTALLQALERDPAVRQRRRLMIAGGAALALATLVAANRIGSSRHNMCAGGDEHFVGVWEAGGVDSPRKQAIGRAFASTGKAYSTHSFQATARLLDEYVGRWVSMYRETCEATHVRHDQSAQVLDLRMKCLQERVGNVRALTDVYTSADESVVLNAVIAAGALPALDACADVPRLSAAVSAPPDPTARERIAALRGRVARFAALRDSGQCAAARKEGPPLLDDVRAADNAPLLAEALFVSCSLGDFCGDARQALRHCQDAYSAAVAGRQDWIAAQAALKVPTMAGNRLDEPAMAKDWLEIARATVKRLGNPERMESVLRSAEGEVLAGTHDFDGEVTKFREAEELKKKTLGADHPVTLTALSNLGDALSDAGRYEEAVEVDRRALRAAERVLGPQHPLVAVTAYNTCEVLNRLGRHDEALASCESALEIWRAAGTDSGMTSYGRTGVGLALLGLGRSREAIGPLETAVADRVSSRLPARLVAESRFALARALWAQTAERPRARTLAKQARADIGGDVKLAASIDAWIANTNVIAARQATPTAGGRH